MKFQCLNESCKKLFHYPMKIREYEEQMPNFEEIQVCPYCRSPDFTEYIEPAPIQEEIANVYVYDLGSGAQPELDKLLAEGYRIVNRFSKQYHLEKPKPKPVEAT